DVHINKEGHQLVADSLIQRIQNEPKGSRIKQYFYDDGHLAAEIQYQGFIKDGTTIYYWDNGEVSQVTNFKNGVKHGLETNYNDTGKRIREQYFLNGKSVSNIQ
ncbi:MAG: hypothetical protein AAFQ20_16960, partial [Bacteroidota bacterium]